MAESREGAAVTDVSFYADFDDENLLEEVELVVNLMAAASISDSHLTRGEIDDALGVVPQPRAGD